MGRNGFFGNLQGIDAFGKTMEDVKIRTRTGALLTILSFSIIATSILLEFVDYRRVHLEPSLEVDRSRGEKLVIEMDVTFPRVPCYMLSLDVMDLSGERQHDISHQMTKARVSKDGHQISRDSMKQLKGDAARAADNADPNYCGSCYGAVPPESGCCNSCEDVRQAYVRQGWQFVDPDGIEQCVEEGWSKKQEEQNTEGCRITGNVRVNKVVGNLQFSFGNVFSRGMSVTDIIPHLKDKNHHDFGHIVHKFHFAADGNDFDRKQYESREAKTRQELGIHDPLEGYSAQANNNDANYMYQYFVKVVSTSFNYLNDDPIRTHQYSLTQYERNLKNGAVYEKDNSGHMTSHHTQAIAGLFINYEISPMRIIHTETRQSFAHFLTSTCAIVGGVLTVASLIDSAIFTSRKHLKGDEYASLTGKMM